MSVLKLSCLDTEFSTTRMVGKQRPEIEKKSRSKLQTSLFLPARVERQGEGGLRTKGYFKASTRTKPLVTVITIVYNRAEYLAGTIESVLEQSYDNVEYVVIDGGSTDGTLDIIRKYEHAIDYWVSEPDSGISDAFNKGIIASTGKWVNFMNCADKFTSPDAIEESISHIDDKADVIFGKANVIDSAGKILLTAGKPFDQEKFYRRMSIPHQSAFHNRHYFEQYGLFDEHLRMAMVYELFLRKSPLAAVFIDETISNMLAGGVHETQDYLRLREVRMVKAKHCSNVPALMIAFDYWRGLARALLKRGLNRIGLRRITLRIRQIESRL